MTDKEIAAVREAIQALHDLIGPAPREVVANGVGSRLARVGAPGGCKTTEQSAVARATAASTVDPPPLNIAADDLERLYSYLERRFIEACHTGSSLLALGQSSILEEHGSSAHYSCQARFSIVASRGCQTTVLRRGCIRRGQSEPL